MAFKEKPIAWVRFTGATGAILQSRGVTSVTRAAAGDYTVNLDGGGVDATEARVSVGVENAAALITSYVHTSDTAKQVKVLDNAGAAADPTTVHVAIYQVAFGSGL